MMERYLLGIDNGGSEIKCALFDLRGRECAVASRRLPLITPRAGHTERNADAVWGANAQAMAEVIQKAGVDKNAIAAVGLTGYGNGLCLVDASGSPTRNCIVSTDTRASACCDKYRRNGAERYIYPMTYQTLWSAQPAALLSWLSENEPETIARSRYALSIKDYIRFKLTASFASEMTDASSGCLFNLNLRRFDPEIFKTLGIEDLYRLMPRCLESTAISGRVTAEAARSTGLAEGTPVAGGYFDIDAGALASGVLDSSVLCLIAGTWSINEYVTPSVNREYEKNANTVTLSYLPGNFLVEDSSPTSASNFDWFVENIMLPGYPGLSREGLYRECDAILARSSPSDEDALFIPYLFCSATNPAAKGTFFNLNNRHGRDDLLRAVYEGVVFSTRFHVKKLRRPVGDYSVARLSGGVSRSGVWTQMMSDALNMPVEILEGSQLSAQGAAMGAGIACGIFDGLSSAVSQMVHVKKRYSPRPDLVGIYERRFASFEKALRALDLFHTP
jgi:L-xylulokinase